MNKKHSYRYPDFNPAPHDPCFCRSGRRFADCCGSTAADRKPPKGVFVIPGFVDPQACRDIVNFAEGQPRQRLKVIDKKRSTDTKMAYKLDDRRITESVRLGRHQSTVNAWVHRALTQYVEPALRIRIEWFELPYLLRYEPGGYYEGHADSEQRNSAEGVWTRVVDRDVSLLLYLNEEFTGGHLYFTKFNYRYQPTPGDLVFFPSDHRFMHEAERLESGVRFALVSWAAGLGMPRIRSGQPDHAIPMDTLDATGGTEQGSGSQG